MCALEKHVLLCWERNWGITCCLQMRTWVGSEPQHFWQPEALRDANRNWRCSAYYQRCTEPHSTRSEDNCLLPDIRVSCIKQRMREIKETQMPLCLRRKIWRIVSVLAGLAGLGFEKSWWTVPGPWTLAWHSHCKVPCGVKPHSGALQAPRGCPNLPTLSDLVWKPH